MDCQKAVNNYTRPFGTIKKKKKEKQNKEHQTPALHIAEKNAAGRVFY